MTQSHEAMSLIRWNVSELTRYISQMFKTDYRLQDLEVEGEVSNWRVPSSGHAYFTLKDENAALKCVMWRSNLQGQGWMPEHGERVIARGRMGVYEAGGDYQLYCDGLRRAGVGDLHARFEELKAQLQAEGLFDPACKRPIPARPRCIGIVTSLSTAALQDVLNVLRRRNPLARVVIADTPVQGEQAAPLIAGAIRALNAYGQSDVILVVRGGGSLEDLWCFNDERVARAIAESAIPVVSGVGHEIDFTLADFAADVRAPTPSAAAELVTPVGRDDLYALLREMVGRIDQGAARRLGDERSRLELTRAHLHRLSPRSALDNARQRLDGLAGRAGQMAVHAIRLRQARLEGLVKTLAAVNPQATLARGYAIVYGPGGAVIQRAAEVATGQHIDVQLASGRLGATVDTREE